VVIGPRPGEDFSRHLGRDPGHVLCGTVDGGEAQVVVRPQDQVEAGAPCSVEPAA
jgi:hypothetical protein